MNCLPRRAAFCAKAATTVAASLGAALWTFYPPAQADTSLTPGATDTNVTTPSAGQYEIRGGELSGGATPNLFHHFVQFDIGAGDQVVFVAPSAIENVIGLIDSSNPARINGTLGLTGSGTNLYLVSPNGVVFGPRARLALPANLWVTTADSLLFGEDELLVEQSGPLDVAGLSGAPTAYVFDILGPSEVAASIDNQGSLAVKPNQSITFLAGSIQTSGSLTARSGAINLAAVPDGYTVRISRPGSLLSLELTPNQANLSPNRPTPIGPDTFSVAAIPERLTGGSATSVGEIVQNEDGSFTLRGNVESVSSSGSNLDEVGTVVVRGDLDVSGNMGGDVSAIGRRIVLIGTDINADGRSVAGTIQIGSLPVNVQRGRPLNLDTVYVYGDRETRLSASGQRPDSSGGTVYIWADDTVQYYGTAEVAGEGSTLFIDAGVDLQRIVPRNSSR